MAKYISEALIAMKLTWFRVFLYFFMPFGLFLQVQTEEWSGETYDNTHGFIKLRLLFIATLLGLNGLAAYIDKSLGDAKAEIAKRRAEKSAGVQAESTGSGFTGFFTHEKTEIDKPKQ